MARDGIARLRRQIAEIEGLGAVLRDTSLPESGADRSSAPSLAPRRSGSVLPFGIPRLDGMLRGGLRRRGLHEIRGEASRNGSATGFALAVGARLAHRDDRPILWIMETAAGREAGQIYGAGLDRFGLDPRHLIVINVGNPADALWAFEEGLGCHGLAAVMAEIRGHPRLLDLTASRRLALRARDSGVMGLLLRQTDRADPGAALTRWLVTPRPAAILDDYPAGIGRPAWHLDLEHNRHGATGTFDLEWDHATRAFAAIDATAQASSRPVAAPASDRSPASPGPGTVVAFRDAS